MSIFKAYDIRGVYGDEVDLETAERIGAAFARFLGGGAGSRKRFVVGHDMRASSPEVTAAVHRGIVSQGCDVIDIGLAETPAVYFATGFLRVDGGLCVTASHNPAQYTGFKMVREDAIPISGDTGIRQIREMVETGDLSPVPTPGAVIERSVDDDYVAHVRRFQKPWRPLKIVIDYANGMGAHLVPRMLEGRGLTIDPLFDTLDGTFPNHEANPLKDENIEDLSKRVLATGADLGATFDGDADRCAFVDEKGQRVPSDIATAMLARVLVPPEPGTAVVYDIRSSHVVPEEIERLGGRPIRERVGHSFMKAVLRREGGVFGGELSGHFYFRENYYSDSGVIALVEMLNIVGSEDRPFSALADELRRYPSTGEINFVVDDADAWIRKVEERWSDGRIDHLDGVTIEYPGWWFNVRKSNTEPLLRLNLEATDPSLFEEKKRELVDFLGEPV